MIVSLVKIVSLVMIALVMILVLVMIVLVIKVCIEVSDWDDPYDNDSEAADRVENRSSILVHRVALDRRSASCRTGSRVDCCYLFALEVNN
jgi:hypothetical protein